MIGRLTWSQVLVLASLACLAQLYVGCSTGEAASRDGTATQIEAPFRRAAAGHGGARSLINYGHQGRHGRGSLDSAARALKPAANEGSSRKSAGQRALARRQSAPKMSSRKLGRNRSRSMQQQPLKVKRQHNHQYRHHKRPRRFKRQILAEKQQTSSRAAKEAKQRSKSRSVSGCVCPSGSGLSAQVPIEQSRSSADQSPQSPVGNQLALQLTPQTDAHFELPDQSQVLSNARLRKQPNEGDTTQSAPPIDPELAVRSAQEPLEQEEPAESQVNDAEEEEDEGDTVDTAGAEPESSALSAPQEGRSQVGFEGPDVPLIGGKVNSLPERVGKMSLEDPTGRGQAQFQPEMRSDLKVDEVQQPLQPQQLDVQMQPIEPRMGLQLDQEPSPGLQVTSNPQVEPESQINLQALPESRSGVQLEPQSPLSIQLQPELQSELPADQGRGSSVQVSGGPQFGAQVDPNSRPAVQVQSEPSLERKTEPETARPSSQVQSVELASNEPAMNIEIPAISIEPSSAKSATVGSIVDQSNNAPIASNREEQSSPTEAQTGRANQESEGQGAIVDESSKPKAGPEPEQARSEGAGASITTGEGIGNKAIEQSSNSPSLLNNIKESNVITGPVGSVKIETPKGEENSAREGAKQDGAQPEADQTKLPGTDPAQVQTAQVAADTKPKAIEETKEEPKEAKPSVGEILETKKEGKELIGDLAVKLVGEPIKETSKLKLKLKLKKKKVKKAKKVVGTTTTEAPVKLVPSSVDYPSTPGQVYYNQPQAYQVANSAPLYRSPVIDSFPEKCRVKVNEFETVLGELLALLETISKRLHENRSIGHKSHDIVAQRLAKIKASAEATRLAISGGNLIAANESGRAAGLELIRLSNQQVCQKLEPSVRTFSSKMRRAYTTYRKACKFPAGKLS